MFFFAPEYEVNSWFKNADLRGNIYTKNKLIKSIKFNYKNIIISSPLTIIISIITLIILLFLFMNKEWLSMGTILVQVLFDY